METTYFFFKLYLHFYIVLYINVIIVLSGQRNFLYQQVDMYAGTIFIQQAIGLDLYAGVVILLGISALYTILGTVEFPKAH